MPCLSSLLAPNVIIGSEPFYALLKGALSPPQIGLVRTEMPYEDGFSYKELGKKAPEEVLILASDFETALESKKALIRYASMKLSTHNIQIRIGSDFITFECYQIITVENITEQMYSAVASGGLTCGQYELITRWIVQQADGVWSDPPLPSG